MKKNVRLEEVQIHKKHPIDAKTPTIILAFLIPKNYIIKEFIIVMHIDPKRASVTAIFNLVDHYTFA